MEMADSDGGGRPCLAPWWSVKLSEVTLLVIIVALGEVCSDLIQWMNDKTHAGC